MMFDLDSIEIFKQHLSSLKQTSYDEANKKFMTEDERSVVDFDSVKEAYLKSLGCQAESISSVDALMQNSAKVIFVEFKNGVMKKEKPKVSSKIKDSLLIFGGLAHSDINYTRENAEFILVYNEEKNPRSSIDNIREHFVNCAKDKDTRFGLGDYKKLYFKNVHTYTKQEFEECLQRLNINF